MLDYLKANWPELLSYAAWTVFGATVALNVIARATKNTVDDKVAGWGMKALSALRKVTSLLALNVNLPPKQLPAPPEDE